MAPSIIDLHSRLRAAKKRAIEYLFLLLMVTLFFSGIVLVIASAAWHLGEVPRDIGISMLVAGTVGLGVELFSRREMEKVLGELLEEKLTQSTTERFGAIESLLQATDQRNRADSESARQHQEDVLPRLDEIRTLIARRSDLLDLGVNRLTRCREENLLRDYIHKAEPGSTIRVLALCLNTLANNSGRDLLKRKLREGCHVRLLLLDPGEAAILEERARQEKRTTEEAIREFVGRVNFWDSVHKSTVEQLASAGISGTIELGYYHSLPSCFLVDNGDVMLVGLYLHGCRGDQCPHLELENKQHGLYQQLEQHFESLWARRTPPFDRRQKQVPVKIERRGLRVAREVAQASG